MKIHVKITNWRTMFPVVTTLFQIQSYLLSQQHVDRSSWPCEMNLMKWKVFVKYSDDTCWDRQFTAGKVITLFLSSEVLFHNSNIGKNISHKKAILADCGTGWHQPNLLSIYAILADVELLHCSISYHCKFWKYKTLSANVANRAVLKSAKCERPMWLVGQCFDIS